MTNFPSLSVTSVVIELNNRGWSTLAKKIICDYTLTAQSKTKMSDDTLRVYIASAKSDNFMSLYRNVVEGCNRRSSMILG